MSEEIELQPMTRSSRSDQIPLFEPTEPVPMTIFYDENVRYSRPSIRELRKGTGSVVGETVQIPLSSPIEEKPQIQFGMWDGVFARCLLSIFGVVMFLRIGWVTGQAGVFLAALIILLCTFVTAVTTLSLSAICTNGEIKGGGAYYLISRSLGPEFGGAIGILFFFANAVGVSLYIVGFSESVATLLEQEQDFVMTSGGEWDEAVYGLCSLTILFFLTLFGVEALVKIQILLLIMIILAAFSVIIGSFICCNDGDRDSGFLGYGQLVDNAGPKFTRDETFFSVLAVFFPAVTGIMAGANISGELKDAQQSIPTGTILAIVASSATYLILAFVAGGVVARGSEDQEDYGLLGNNLIFAHIAFWEPLLLIGIFAASLSSAMTTLDGAPRILQAVAKDKIFPYFEFFAVGYGKNSEPIRGYAFTAFIAAICIVAGNLNSIATIITNFYLISYAFINYACFAASVTKAPGWRPSFRYYNKWVALLGSILCIVAMFLIDWIAALVTFGCFLSIYKYVDFVKPAINWGSATQAKIYLDALTNLATLATISPHVKTFRPQIIVFVRDDEVERNNIVFAARCSGGSGLTLCAKIYLAETTDIDSLRKAMESRDKLVLRDDVDDVYVFFHTIASTSMREGWKNVIQGAGIGKMRPNIAFFGFKENWNSSISANLVEDYVNMIRDAFDLGYSVGIMRGIRSLETTKTFSGRIDVYWLSDDGGLTVLLPYILQSSAQWKRTSLRVLSKCTEKNVAEEEKRMKNLLKRFRIRADVKLIEGLDEGPSEHTIGVYNGFGEEAEEALEIPKTKFILRFSELIRIESMDADLVVMYLPIPTEHLSARIYMSWLHQLTKDLPQVLLLRGNQESVITYYS